MPDNDPNKKSFESSHLMSPAPGTPQTKDKAWVGGLIGAVGSAVVGYFASGQDVNLRGIIAVVVVGVAGYFGVALKSNRAKRDERGDVASMLVTVVVIVVAVFLALVLFNRCDGDRDRDGKKGLDWERAPIAQTFESSHK